MRLLLKRDFCAINPFGFACFINLAQHLKIRLQRRITKCFVQWFANYIALTDQAHVQGIGKGKNVIRPFQHGDKAGRLFKHLAQPATFMCKIALQIYLAGDFLTGAKQAHNGIPGVTHRRVGKRKMGLFGIAVAIHGQLQVVYIDRLARPYLRHQRANCFHNIMPDFSKRHRLCGRMAFAAKHRIGVIVEHMRVRPPAHIHGLGRSKNDTNRRLQHHWPLVWRAQWVARPVCLTQQSTAFTTVPQER